ncbi:unnamed protein product [Knipowitschia caucasica]
MSGCCVKKSIPECLEELKNIFSEHAGREGDPQKLNKNELKTLLEAHMFGKCKEATEEEAKKMFDGWFNTMDENQDGEVDFYEYMVFLAAFSCFCFGIDCETKK